uniref:Uncharacterized protein n=1 Tax=Anguilla anguilla TaxID=7936 RepID=A0A0E9U2L2_ANGAN
MPLTRYEHRQLVTPHVSCGTF